MPALGKLDARRYESSAKPVPDQVGSEPKAHPHLSAAHRLGAHVIRFDVLIIRVEELYCEFPHQLAVFAQDTNSPIPQLLESST